MGYAVERQKLVEGLKRNYLQHRIEDERVLAAIGKVPRHEFVPDNLIDSAYEDSALPVGCEQTISQPFVVAAMTQALDVEPGMRVLEIGTGSGYQTAVLAEMGAEVFSIEYHQPLAREAMALLQRSGYEKVHVRSGDGTHGWAEAAPFDGIIVTCCAPSVVDAWKEQLRDGGRLVVPLETVTGQDLVRITRHGNDLRRETLFPVRFVPLLG